LRNTSRLAGRSLRGRQEEKVIGRRRDGKRFERFSDAGKTKIRVELKRETLRDEERIVTQLES